MPEKATIPRICEQCGSPLTTRDQERFCSRACAGEYARADLPARFWSRVTKDGPVPEHCPELGPCWLWIGVIGDVGYGAISVEGRMQRAHRVAWQLAYGPIPEGKRILHDCDNKRCVNPSHLHVGTHAQNTLEAQERELFNSKLTADSVREIRRRAAVYGTAHKVLAVEYGVSTAAIDHVCTRRNWAHVD